MKSQNLKMNKIEESLYKILKKADFVKQEDLEDAYQSSKELDRSLTDILVFRGLISEDALSQLIAENLKVPHVSLKNRIIPDEILSFIPETLARKYRMIPFEKTEKELHLAMEDPENFEALELAKRRTDLKIKMFFVSRRDLARALNQYKRDIKKKFKKIITDNVKKASLVNGDVKPEKLLKVASDLPVVKILDAILEYAVAENASDLHFEVLDDLLMVRLRVDGVLNDILTLPREVHPSVVARIKVLSNLKIDEHRLPQDGRFKFQIDEALVGVRVSIIPAFFGENVVLRILAESARPLSLEELGFAGKNLEIIKKNITKPNGMILVTGPTGCGKTTSLYSILNILNTVKVKICTVEDPIEYSISRVNQIQINPKTGLTFAMGLRSLLRHDPDIIMVGEIRDEETADMAIHSALTGHLVLSTLHTNDAPSTIPRLLDVGAEGYLLASTINIAIAQRLVRRICPSCIEQIEPPKEALDHITKLTGKTLAKQKFYRGKGCDKCRNSGYRGRIGVFEVMEINEEIRQLVVKKTSVEKIREAAIKSGMVSMFEDGLDKIGAGLTTIEQVLSAIKQ